MNKVKLTKYLETNSQQSVADAFGIFQTAVSQMVTNGRDIYLEIDKRGKIRGGFEIKRMVVKK